MIGFEESSRKACTEIEHLIFQLWICVISFDFGFLDVPHANVGAGAGVLEIPVEGVDHDPEVDLQSAGQGVDDDGGESLGVLVIEGEAPDGQDEGDDHQGDEDDGADKPDQNEKRLLLLDSQQEENVD